MINIEYIKEIIELNKKELFFMAKEYIIVYIKLLLLDLYEIEKRKQIKEYISKYSETIKLENLYLQMIVDNIDYIDEEKTEELIVRLDDLNEETYKYYDEILCVYENSIFQDNCNRITIYPKKTKFITENESLYIELLNAFSLPQDIELKQKTKKINKILNKSIKN